MNNISKFRDGIEKINEICEKSEDENLTFEERMTYYKEGMEAYKVCFELLEKSKDTFEVLEEDMSDAE